MTEKEKPLGKKELHSRIDNIHYLRVWEKAELKKMLAKDKLDSKITESQFDEMSAAWARTNVEDRLFVQRGYKFGTVNESWDAVRELAHSLEEGKLPSSRLIEWYTAAVERCNGNDATDLVRQLGLFVHGRHRKVDPETVVTKVNALINSGSSIMAACGLVADELGCSLKTVHRWYSTGKSK